MCTEGEDYSNLDLDGAPGNQRKHREATPKPDPALEAYRADIAQRNEVDAWRNFIGLFGLLAILMLFLATCGDDEEEARKRVRLSDHQTCTSDRR